MYEMIKDGDQRRIGAARPTVERVHMSSAAHLEFEFETSTGAAWRQVQVTEVVVGGWTGRDEAALQAHIEELAALGIPGPDETPMFYRVSAAHLTTADEIQVVGGDTSGEVEYFVVVVDDELWLGAASEHTDRKAETQGITIAKQLCEKPLSSRLWPVSELAPHWDQLILRAWIHENGERVLYQEGSLSEMRHVDELIERYTNGGRLSNGTLLFGGTLAAIGGVRPASRFEFEIEDPVLNRRLSHGYDIQVLPNNG
jgi:hypothetical protein